MARSFYFKGDTLARRKYQKKIKYGVRIHNWDVFHSFSTKSEHFDHRGYFESSTITLTGELWVPKLKNVQKTSITLHEDSIQFLDRDRRERFPALPCR